MTTLIFGLIILCLYLRYSRMNNFIRLYDSFRKKSAALNWTDEMKRDSSLLILNLQNKNSSRRLYKEVDSNLFHIGMSVLMVFYVILSHSGYSNDQSILASLPIWFVMLVMMYSKNNSLNHHYLMLSDKLKTVQKISEDAQYLTYKADTALEYQERYRILQVAGYQVFHLNSVWMMYLSRDKLWTSRYETTFEKVVDAAWLHYQNTLDNDFGLKKKNDSDILQRLSTQYEGMYQAGINQYDTTSNMQHWIERLDELGVIPPESKEDE